MLLHFSLSCEDNGKRERGAVWVCERFILLSALFNVPPSPSSCEQILRSRINGLKARLNKYREALYFLMTG